MYSNPGQPPLQYPGQSYSDASGGSRPSSGQPYGQQTNQPGQPYGQQTNQPGQPYGQQTNQPGQPYGQQTNQQGQPYGQQTNQPGQPHGQQTNQPGQPYGQQANQPGQPYGQQTNQPGQPYGQQTNQPGQPYGQQTNQPGQPYGSSSQQSFSGSSYHPGKPPHGGPSQQPGQPYGSSPNTSGQAYGGWPNSGPDTEAMLWFQAVDADGSGRIEAKELRQALTNGNWSHFSDDACRLMIGMFDRDQTKSIDVNEFQQLWRYLQEWRQVYSQVDKDRSGYIEHGELHQALTAMGYQLSPDFIRVAIDRFDVTKQRHINLDSFIVCCVLLHQLTEVFKQKDVERKGEIRISYEEFMNMAISGIP